MGECDSCGDDVDILLPLRVCNESNQAIGMIERWYCIECWKLVTREWAQLEEEGDDDDEE